MLASVAVQRATVLLWMRDSRGLLDHLRGVRKDDFIGELTLIPPALFAAWAHELLGDAPAARRALDPALAYLDLKLSELPHKPGVYLMKDRFGTVIYVGKARDLRKRVSQYFQSSRRMGWDLKFRALVEAIHDFDIHLVRSEPEALLLEGSLIRLWSLHDQSHGLPTVAVSPVAFLALVAQRHPAHVQG